MSKLITNSIKNILSKEKPIYQTSSQIPTYSQKSYHHLHKMLELKQVQQKKSKVLYESYQKDYIFHLKSLLPSNFLEQDDKHNASIFTPTNNMSKLEFFNTKAMKNIKSHPSLTKSRLSMPQNKKGYSCFGQFLLKLVKNIAQQRYVDEYGSLEAITKELGIDIKQLNKIDDSEAKIQFMLNSIDKQIEDQKRKVLYSRNAGNGSNGNGQKLCSFTMSINSFPTKENNFMQGADYVEKIPSKYESFIREQNKKEVDNFAWLEIKTKYPMLEKKLKSKLIQSINEQKNEKRIRELIDKKQKSKKLITNNSTASHQNIKKNSSARINNSYFAQNPSVNPRQLVDIQDQKIDLSNESLFMEEFEKAKIDYVWTDSDEKMFIKNIKELRKKCSNNSEFLKLCERFKFISQKEFETLASEEISRMLNQNNKIYLSREFLLDKYFSTTEILTEQEMRFILKTSPMLSKCVDRNFIKTAIKNIKYENISDLELKIAQDIIGRFEKLRNSVRASRKAYKQQINQATKERIAYFEYSKQLQIAKEIAHQQLKNHKTHLMRAINFNKKHPLECSSTPSSGLSKKKTKNVWTPLNKFHPSTGLFVKDCNQQCTDDIFNPYQKLYLNQIHQSREPPKQNIYTKVQMIKFYSGGPDQNITTTFNVTENDIRNICSIVKAFYFEKRILSALQSIEIVTMVANDVFETKREDTKSLDVRTKKTLGLSQDEEYELMAKKKLIQNREKAKEAVYVSKLLLLAGHNSFASLKALNPQFTPQQVNTKDKKGNTALFYAAKFGNQQFVQFLMKFGANPNTKCQRQYTPLHYGFKSNNINLILKLFTSSYHSPNLNLLNNQSKTPLAYASREVLKKLNLQQGVACMDPNAASMVFDNNTLLQKGEFDRIKEQSLEVEGGFGRKVNQNSQVRKMNSTVTSLQNMHVE